MEHQKPENQKPEKLRKESIKTSTIAISILLTVSLTLIGFEILDKKGTPPSQSEDKGAKSLLIFTQDKERESAGLATNLNYWEEEKGTEPTTLKEINRLQANKINALKRQVIEANQKLHEVKGHLFTKGDPADRARLAEICQELVERDRKNYELSEKLAELQTERDLREQKINRMEHTIDALAAMTDHQRSTKDQAIFTFQTELEQLQESASKEREEYEKALADLQQSQAALKETLTEKLASIKHLEEEMAWQYSVLSEKDKEIQKQSQLYTASEGQINSKMQDLATLLEIENARKNDLRSDLEISLARQHAQEQYSKSLETRLAQTEENAKESFRSEANIAENLIREYFDLQGLLDVYAHSHDQLMVKTQKLTQLVRDEQERGDNLGNELDHTYALFDNEQARGICLEEELHAAAAKVENLLQDIQRQDQVIAAKSQELEILTYSQASLKDQLNEKIAQLNAALSLEQLANQEKEEQIRELAINWELERTRAQELDARVKEVAEDYQHESEVVTRLEIQLSQKAEALSALEDRLNDKQSEISSLRGNLDTLTKDFEQEKIRSGELHRALVSALDENENDHASMQAMDETISKHTDTLALLQDRIDSKRKTLEDFQQRFDELAFELDAERQKNQELTEALTIASTQKDVIEDTTRNLETSLGANTQTIVSLQDTLADKQQEIRQLFSQIETLTHESRQQQSAIASLKDELDQAYEKDGEAQAVYRNLQAVAQELDAEKRKNQQLVDSLTAAMSQTHSVDERARSLEAAASSHTETIADLQDTLADKQSEIRGLFDQISSLRGELEVAHEREFHAHEDSSRVAEQKRIIEELNRKISVLESSVELEKSRALAFEKAQTKELEHTAQLQREAEEAKSNSKEVAYEQTVSSPEEKKSVQEAISHTVKRGETLSSISKHYYGTPDRWGEIYNANKKKINDKNHLAEGTSLIIPK